jgi:hypothetical protein
MRKMSENEGTFQKGKPVPDYACRSCRVKGHVVEEEWESSCGGYEDYKYTCTACEYVWWVDGIDS